MPQIRIGSGRNAGNVGGQGVFSPPSFNRISNFALNHLYAPKVILNVFLKFRFGSHQILTEGSTYSQLPTKVIVEKSRGEVSLMGQDTIENVS